MRQVPIVAYTLLLEGDHGLLGVYQLILYRVSTVMGKDLAEDSLLVGPMTAKHNATFQCGQKLEHSIGSGRNASGDDLIGNVIFTPNAVWILVLFVALFFTMLVAAIGVGVPVVDADTARQAGLQGG